MKIDFFVEETITAWWTEEFNLGNGSSLMEPVNHVTLLIWQRIMTPLTKPIPGMDMIIESKESRYLLFEILFILIVYPITLFVQLKRLLK